MVLVAETTDGRNAGAFEAVAESAVQHFGEFAGRQLYHGQVAVPQIDVDEAHKGRIIVHGALDELELGEFLVVMLLHQLKNSASRLSGLDDDPAFDVAAAGPTTYLL